MTATEKVIFDQVFKHFQETYPEVKVEHPYDDAYMIFVVNGTAIDGFNPEGHNLLYCLSELTKAYEFELR